MSISNSAFLALPLSIALAGSGLAFAAEESPAKTEPAPAAAPAKSAAPAPDEEKARNYFTDLPTVNQDGKTMRFYSDVLKDQVVLISFIFTNCQDACPLITRKLVEAREALGEDLRDKVRFISLSVDPERDTPEAMKAFAKKNQADFPNWYFLTGDKQNLEFIVKRLGQYTDEVEAHTTLTIAGNVKAAHWKKIPPMVPPAGIALMLRELADEQG
jgi:cytochrome oxidase Cu insertion factor (SCO1/SenC/PrrC family)